MNEPEVKIISHPNHSVIKRVSSEDTIIEFTAPDTFEYDIWTDFELDIFHSLKPLKIAKNTYRISLSTDITGFYDLIIRYKNKYGEFNETNAKIQIHVDPEWITDTIVYNIFVRAFKSKEVIPGEGGTFEQILEHMDELVEMGVGCIYLNPFHLIGELYRKYNPSDSVPSYLQPGSPYSIRDPKSIDPELAFNQKDTDMLLKDPKKQFKKLVDAAHKKGIRVMMDLVFNHTSHDFVLQRIFPEWFYYKDDIQSMDDPFLYQEDIAHGKPWGNAKNTLLPFDHHAGFAWSDVAQLNWEYMEPPGPNKPPRNTKKHEMYEYFKSIPKYWIKEFGIDGFRCDVAYRVPPDFWRECIEEAKRYAKDIYPESGSIDGEVIFVAESYVDDLALLLSSGFSLAYGDFSNKIYSPETLKGYVDYMYNIGTNDFPDGAKWFIFPECHDFSRSSSKLVPLHDKENEKLMRANGSRWILTATLPGMPMIFNGFEKSEWHQVDHVSYSKMSWSNDSDISPLLKAVNSIRNSSIALKEGDYTYIPLKEGLNDSTQIFSFARHTEDEIMIIAVNMDIYSESGATLKIPTIRNFNPNAKYVLTDQLTEKMFERSDSELNVVLGPGDAHIFSVKQNWGD